MFELSNRRYLGSKTRLLGFIQEVMDTEGIQFNSFLDLFAGTGVVANYFNKENNSIIVNDFLFSNYIIYKAWFTSDEVDKQKLERIIDNFNNTKVINDNYFSENFSNTYFDYETSKKIGYIREKINDLKTDGKINDREEAILIASLLYAMDRIANTVGHYDAYRLNGSYEKKLNLELFNLVGDNINKNNLIYKSDANDLVKNISADVVYIDPPYNSRQYGDAYHLLENVAEWKKEDVFGVAKKMDRTHIKSKYSMQKATQAFEDLIESIDAKYIILSYNNMGKNGASRSQAKIEDNDIFRILESKGKVSVFETDFNFFNTGKTNLEQHKERIFICKVGLFDDTLQKYEHNISHVKSPLNYTGGKFKILDQIFTYLPDQIDTFIDLFGGGFNVGANVTANKIIYNDNQKQLVRILNLFYNHKCHEIFKRIEKIIKEYSLSNTYINGYEFYECNSDSGVGKYNKENYLKLRADYNKANRDSINRDYLLLTLIIYSFNNQIRFNSKGEFNMPVGKRDFNSSLRKNLVNFVSKIQKNNIEINNKDFRNVTIEDYDATFVYCDPPYILGIATYNENLGWTEKDELDLLEYLKDLSLKGSKFALSNVILHKGKKHDILMDWAIINEYNIHYIDKDYNNSNYQKKNKNEKTIEVLITNY
jgi:adenine-specific DNA-methyltransferase